MSTHFTLSFSRDMPPAAVDLVASDQTTIGHVVMRSGRSSVVDLPEDARFLRIHMPDGRVVTLPRGKGPLEVTRTMVDPAARRSADDRERRARYRVVNDFERTRSGEISAAFFDTGNVHSNRLSLWQWSLDSRQQVPGKWEWAFPGDSIKPQKLRGKFGLSSVVIEIPGNVRSVWIEDSLEEADSFGQAILLGSRAPLADTILSYLQNGQMDAAKSVVGNATARVSRMEIFDPYAGSVAAYLLLRVGMIENLDAYTDLLVRDFPQIPDVFVIRASYLLVKDPRRIGEIEELLTRATAGLERDDLPVYTEGTRLLIDALLMLGNRGRARLDAVRAKLGFVHWQSPVTTRFRQGDSATTLPPVRVRFA